MRFCTEEQLIRYGRYKGYEDIENRIALLVGAGVLNSFFETMLNPKDGIIRKPDDAKRYICLKVAGEYLLREFSPRKIIEWEPGDNITHIKNIENQEILNEVDKAFLINHMRDRKMTEEIFLKYGSIENIMDFLNSNKAYNCYMNYLKRGKQ